MAISRAERRALREPAFRAVFGDDTEVALDLVELTEFAWHDCYGEVAPPQRVVDDMVVCSEGRVTSLVRAAYVAVQDARDLHVWADDVRRRSMPP